MSRAPIKGRTMTERQIQRALYWMCRDSCSVIMPNFTPYSWWECDIFAVTHARYFREYEIKLSVSDFKADRNKKRGRCIRKENPDQDAWDRYRYESVWERKHQMLEDRNINGPVEFSFVVPDGLVKPEDVPPWAGLYYATWRWESQKYPTLTVVRKPKRLHREKINQRYLDGAFRSAYYRFWSQLHMIDDRGGKMTDESWAEDDKQAETSEEQV